MSTTLSELRDLVAESFGIDPATIDAAKPVVEFGIDSLALAELLFAAEDRFNVDLSDRAGSVATLEELAAFIDRKRAAASVPAPTSQAAAG